MRIVAAKQVSNRRLDMTMSDESRQGSVNQESGDTATPGRALVSITPPQTEPRASTYRQAAFLTQLIATRDHAPQTRERRRALPEEAISAYRAAAALTSRSPV